MPTKLAEQLSALMAYRNRSDHKPEPVTSNWSVVPANDNAVTKRSERLADEKLLKVTPSIEEILRNMREDWVWKGGKLVSIGRLRFSDGTAYEPALVRTDDGSVERKLVRVRAGAMLGCNEALTEDAGGQGSAVMIGNAEMQANYFPKTDAGDVITPRTFIPSGRRRQGKSLSPRQSRALISEAIANTKAMPPVTKCPPGVASGTAQFSEQFIGMKIGSTGKGGMIHWVDLYTAGLEHDAWVKAHSSLSKNDRETLDLTLTAKNLADVGRSGHRRSRERQAVKRLRAVNDNYLAALRSFAA